MLISRSIKTTIMGYILFSLAQSPVFAGSPTMDVKWVLSMDSPLLDHSSQYLATGHVDAGIRYANKALKRGKSSLNEVIANHNLCIAWHIKGDLQTAAPYCETALELSKPQIPLKVVTNNMYRVLKRSHGADYKIDLETLITKNLAQIDDGRKFSNVARMELKE